MRLAASALSPTLLAARCATLSSPTWALVLLRVLSTCRFVAAASALFASALAWLLLLRLAPSLPLFCCIILPQFKLGVAFRPEILVRRFSELRLRA